jgi:hypothetical protein
MSAAESRVGILVALVGHSRDQSRLLKFHSSCAILSTCSDDHDPRFKQAALKSGLALVLEVAVWKFSHLFMPYLDRHQH